MPISQDQLKFLLEYIDEEIKVEIFKHKFLLKEGVETIDWNRARDLIRATKGKIFTVTFIKRSTGEERLMNCRIGVKKYLHGGTLPYYPDDYDLIPVFDLKKSKYRMISADTLKSLKIGNDTYIIN